MLRPDLYIAYWSFFLRFNAFKISTIHQETFKALKIQYNFTISFLSSLVWNLSHVLFDKVVVLNNVIKDQVWFVSSNNISIVGNGIPRIVSNYSIDDSELLISFSKKFDFVIGSCSLLIKRKGLDQIIRALKFLPRIGYIVVGDGPEKSNLMKLATNLGVLEQCLFIGSKPNGFRYFSHFDAYVLSSLSEGYPISAIEAARLGVPIVGSKIAVLCEIFSVNEISFFELNNTSSLVKAIQNIKDKREQYSLHILDKYESTMTDRIMVNNYLKIYNNHVQK
jgi:glycosyltransferase involved in cell wall biosynthesis